MMKNLLSSTTNIRRDERRWSEVGYLDAFHDLKAAWNGNFGSLHQAVRGAIDGSRLLAYGRNDAT